MSPFGELSDRTEFRLTDGRTAVKFMGLPRGYNTIVWENDSTLSNAPILIKMLDDWQVTVTRMEQVAPGASFWKGGVEYIKIDVKSLADGNNINCLEKATGKLGWFDLKTLISLSK